MLDAVDLDCMRGDRLLFKGINFKVAESELLYIKGANGAGKTTLLRMICGLVQPYGGTISWNSENIKGLHEDYYNSLLYIGHLGGIKPELTALENLRFACALNGQDVSEKKATDALKSVGLAGREDLPSKVLSQGQQRRVALARLFLTHTKLWVLDEPFVALDVKAVAMIQRVLAEHLVGKGMIVLTTHQEFSVSKGTVKHLLLGDKLE